MNQSKNPVILLDNNYKNSEVKVSVIVTTYNHGKYLNQCLDGILSQKTSYTYEIIVHDDASNDNTPQIISEYYHKYPGIIRAILQHENIYSQGKSVFDEYYRFVRGEYIATCEGDDFWIDDYKLEKQISFLENNLEYIAVYHRALVVDHSGKSMRKLYPGLYSKPNFSIKELRNYNLPGQTATRVYRNFWSKIKPDIYKDYQQCKGVGDRKLALILTLQGKVYYSDDIMSAYRYVTHFGDSYSARNHGQNRTYISFEEMLSMNNFSKKNYNKIIFSNIRELQILWDSFAILLKQRRKQDMEILIQVMKKMNDLNVVQVFLYFIYRIVKYPFVRILIKIQYYKNLKKIYFQLTK